MKTRTFETVRLEELRRRGLLRAAGQRKTARRALQVLVVDDERVTADALVGILSTAGFSASAAYNREAALAAVRRAAPDVLISDVSMRRVDGLDLARKIRKLAPSCRTVLISGSPASYQVMHAADELGPFRFLTKPVRPRDLIGLLSTW